MSNALQRGLVLLQQARWDLADREFRQALTEEPDNAAAHAFLSICLLGLDKNADSLHEATEAMRLDPELPFARYAQSRAFQALDRLREAETAIAEAIHLDPDDADYRGALAGILAGRRRWPEALSAANTGLALDASNNTCLNFRALALVHLGQKGEAARTLGSALADNPEDALTHANQGWTYLHQGDHVKALEHFREALRLEPSFEWARAGIIESLKAKHLIYRWMLKFFLWMGRQSQRAQWVVILGFIFGRKILADIARTHPALAPWIWPIIALSFGFLMLTWVASPVFNFALQFNKFGRMALTRGERFEANAIGGCFLAAITAFVINILTGSTFAFISMAFFGFLLPPIAVTFRQRTTKGRLILAAFTFCLAGLCIPIFAFIFLGPASPFGGLDKSLELFEYFLIGAMLSTWVPALTGLRD